MNPIEQKDEPKKALDSGWRRRNRSIIKQLERETAKINRSWDQMFSSRKANGRPIRRKSNDDPQQDAV